MSELEPEKKQSAKSILNEFLDAVDISKSYFKVFLELSYRPHKVIRNYIAGDTIVNPFKYLVLVVTINYFSRFLYNDNDVLSRDQSNGQLTEIGFYAIQYLGIILFILLNALFLHLIKKKASHYGFINYLSGSIYVISHSLLIFSLISILGLIFGAQSTWQFETYVVLPFLGYIIWASDWDNKINKALYVTSQIITLILAVISTITIFKFSLNLSIGRHLVTRNPVIGIYIDEGKINEDNPIVEIQEFLPNSFQAIHIDSVLNYSPAKKAGLLKGDQILKIEETYVDFGLYNSCIGFYNPNDEINITLKRRDSLFVKSIRLAHPDSFSTLGGDKTIVVR